MRGWVYGENLNRGYTAAANKTRSKGQSMADGERVLTILPVNYGKEKKKRRSKRRDKRGGEEGGSLEAK